MSTLSYNKRKDIRGKSDVFLEEARDSLRYKFGRSKRPPRLLNRNMKHATSMPNMNSQMQIAKQPTRPAPGLPPKGPIMFGGFLRDAVDEATGASQFVVWCVDAVETTGDNLKSDALYRASGNQAKVQEIATTSEDQMWEKLCKEDNVNNLTGALKLYFRQLKRPIMEYSDFNRAFLTDDPVEETRLLVGGLPAAERKTLSFLMHHLHRVLEHEADNKMGVQGLALVFGPTLMRLVPNSLDIGGDMKQQNRIVELLLAECHAIFPARSMDAVDGSHKGATLDITRRQSDSSDGEAEDGDVAVSVELRKRSDSSGSDGDKRHADSSSDSDGSTTKRNLMATIVRNRESSGLSQTDQQKGTTRLSESDSDEDAPDAIYATVEKNRPKKIVASTRDSSLGRALPSADSDEDAFDLPPPPPIPIDYPREAARIPSSRERINIAAKDVDQYNIEAISYRRKSNSDSSDSDDAVKYRKRVTALQGDNRSGMIQHFPKVQETIEVSKHASASAKDNSYGHNIVTIGSQYKPAAPNATVALPLVDSNFSLDTYSNRYKKPQSTRKVGEEANKRISAVFGKSPKGGVDEAGGLREGKKSTPADSHRRRSDSDDSSSNSDSSEDSQQRHRVVDQGSVFKPTAL